MLNIPSHLNLEPTVVTIEVTDPDVLLALSEYPDEAARSHFVTTALRVGVLSLRAARSTVDADKVRKEADRLLEQLDGQLGKWRGEVEEKVNGSLSRYFDPNQGTFSERVNRLTHADGDIATVIRQQMRDAEGQLSRMFEQFVGENSQLIKALDPSGENQLVSALRRSVDEVVQAQNREVLNQFSLDNRDSALVRFLNELSSKHGDLNVALSRNMQSVVDEFSLDRKESALSRLVERVDSHQRALTAELSLDTDGSALHRLWTMLQAHQATVLEQQNKLASSLEVAVQSLQVRREESAKSTRHGNVFEEDLGAHLRPIVQQAGDVLEAVGTTTGIIPKCKVGDFVITLGPDHIAAGARIVIEAKESTAYTLKQSLDEADVALRNRQAGTCIFVHSARTAGADIERFKRYGNILVTRWDAQDPTQDVWLQAAHMVAVAMSVQRAAAASNDSINFSNIDEGIGAIRKQLDGFEEINSAADTARRAAVKIDDRARIMKKELLNALETIVAELAKQPSALPANS